MDVTFITVIILIAFPINFHYFIDFLAPFFSDAIFSGEGYSIAGICLDLMRICPTFLGSLVSDRT